MCWHAVEHLFSVETLQLCYQLQPSELLEAIVCSSS